MIWNRKSQECEMEQHERKMSRIIHIKGKDQMRNIFHGFTTSTSLQGFSAVTKVQGRLQYQRMWPKIDTSHIMSGTV